MWVRVRACGVRVCCVGRALNFSVSYRATGGVVRAVCVHIMFDR